MKRLLALAMLVIAVPAYAQLSSTPFDYRQEQYRQQQLMIQQQILNQQRMQQYEQERYNQEQLNLQRQMLNQQRQQTNEMRIAPYLYPQQQPYPQPSWYGR